MNNPTIFTRKTKENLHAIYIRVIINRKKADVSLKLFVHEKDWNDKRNEVKRSDIEYIRKNKYIDKAILKAKNIIDKLFYEGNAINFNIREFKRLYKNAHIESKDFYSFVENEFKSRVTNKDTLRTYLSQITKLKQFRSELNISDLDIDFILLYKKYMIDVKGNNQNTYNKSLSMLRTFFYWAIDKGLAKENPFKKIKISKIPGQRDFLTAKEVEKLEHLYSSNILTPGVQNVLKYFLFTCYTGLRFGDVRDLKFSDIKNIEFDDKKVDFIKTDMHKTGLPVSIPIIERAKVYIQRKFSNNQKVFDVKTNQTTNKHLKTIATKAEINKNITFHVARYTIGTIGLEYGLPIETISDILGHTDIRITKRLYAKTDDHHKFKEMSKMEKKQ